VIDPTGPDLGPRLVTSLVARIRATGAKIERKADSAFMGYVAGFLDTFKIMPRARFMRNTFTTIDGTIYYPGGELGVPWQGEGDVVWTVAQQVGGFLHEYTHTLQPAEQGGQFLFDVNYLLHKLSRVHDETDPRATQMWWKFRTTGAMDDPRAFAAQLSDYGVEDPKLIEHSATILALSAETIADGGLPNAATEFAEAWIQEECPWIVGHPLAR